MKLDKFSLSGRQIYADFIKMENAHGELSLKTSSKPKDPRKKSGPGWDFKLTRSDLSDVLFTLNQPDKKSRMEFSLAGGDISDAGVDLGKSRDYQSTGFHLTNRVSPIFRLRLNM
ncbi:MAG: hypothetical protein U5L72_12525 [Bacteroidales bacterium]|nr:hypothetical protein [Bacteroidales bacterium]